MGPHRYRRSVELPGYYALQVRLHLLHRLVPESRDVLRLALIRFWLVALRSYRGVRELNQGQNRGFLG